MKLQLTDLEKLAIENIVNYRDSRAGQKSDNYSNLGFDRGCYRIFEGGKATMTGVVTSLVKKGLVWVDEAYDDIPAMVWFCTNKIDEIFDAMGWDMENSPSNHGKTPIKIEPGQQIKTPYDQYRPEIIVNTSKNFSKNGTHIGPEGTWLDESIEFHLEGWKIWERNCGRDWKRHYLWANQSPCVLTANYPGKAEAMRKKEEAYDNALMLDDGDIVEVDGMQFEVHCVKRNHVADPVHFTYVGEAA